MSSKLCLSLLALGLAPAALAQSTVLVPAGSDWSYLDDGSDLGTSWVAPAFDDTSWASGPAQLGYGDSDEATVVSFGPSSSDKYITTYFRHSFTVADPSGFLVANVRLLRDDGAAVYLNGTEITRSNLPGGPIDYQTLAASTVSGSSEDIFHILPFDPALLLPGTNVLAAEVHQRSADSSDLSFDLEVRAGDEVSVSRGPYLQKGTSTAVTVRWSTDLPTDSRVFFGTEIDMLTSFVDDPVVSLTHELEVTGLQPDTRYFYTVGGSAAVLSGPDVDQFFVTAPTPGEPHAFRAWILGDSGTADSNAAAVKNAYENFAGTQHTNLWLMLGDNAYTEGTDAEYQAAVFEMYPAMLKKSVLWLTRGNHEMFANVYYDLFNMPTQGEAGGTPSISEAYYSFDWANVHFVCLDSTGSSSGIGSPMRTWLAADLAATGQEWIIAFWHHPPYSKGSHDSDEETSLIRMREDILPLLEDHGVDLVLSGHSHSYERSFLIDGHYADSNDFGPMHIIDGGDGRLDGDGGYQTANGPHAGSVYCVAGSSGQVSGAPLDHPVMFHSIVALGSVVLDVDGGQMNVSFLRSNGEINDHFTLLSEAYIGPYCVSQTDTTGCAGALSGTGTPSMTAPAPFNIVASGISPDRWGMLFYGLNPTGVPFLSGTLCVQSPFQRTTPQVSTGMGVCQGNFTFDFNAQIQSGFDPNLVPGQIVYSQLWYRDPGDPLGSALTDALQFTVQP